jgi:two-component system cell cycle sensor histidine kinase PleC
LLNILSNSVKFTDPQGQIRIGSLIDSAGDLLISIRDTGVGIAPEHLQRVLEPFEQAEDLFTRENHGAGLGLPIAKALIELHGGELVLSSDLGVGTTVTLRLLRDRVHGLL